MSEKISVRRQSRELALQALCHFEFAQGEDYQASLRTFKGNFPAANHVWDYADHLLAGIEQNRSAIDQMIESQSSHWKLARMAMVDRNLLRIAVFEIQYTNGEVPPKVAINEAIELSKKFGNSDSAAFINGILDQIAKREA